MSKIPKKGAGAAGPLNPDDGLPEAPGTEGLEHQPGPVNHTADGITRNDVIRNLATPLPEPERAVLLDGIVTDLTLRSKLDSDRKAYASAMKSQIDILDDKVAASVKNLNEGIYSDVTCVETLDRVAGMYKLVRTDTGETVEERPLTPEEGQLEIPTGDGVSDGPDDFSDVDPTVYEEAVKMIIEAGQGSTSVLQRRLKLGFGRASRILDRMEAEGLIGPAQGGEPRKLLVAQ